MARTYSVKNLAIPVGIYEALEKKKQEQGRLGSLTAFVSEILSRYVSGALVSKELLAAELRTNFLQEMQGRESAPPVPVKGHRPAREGHGIKRKAI